MRRQAFIMVTTCLVYSVYGDICAHMTYYSYCEMDEHVPVVGVYSRIHYKKNTCTER